MERFLYRLSVSDYAEAFYLKGALLFWVWNLPERRTTMDIDQRGTSCSLDNPLFGEEMKQSAAKQSQWSAFLRKNKLTTCPESFAGLLDELFVFLLPVVAAIETGEATEGRWTAGSGWQSDES
jgi:hypothetical protein